MTTPSQRPAPGPASLVDEAVALGRRWLATARTGETSQERATSGRLAALVADAAGLDLAVRFIDRVVRPEEDAVAAAELFRLRHRAPRFLGPADRLLFAVGARLAPAAPGMVVPLARRRLRQIVGHLVVDAHDPALGRHLARARADGVRLNLNLLGEAVLGEAEAASRTRRTIALLARDDVDYVSVKVSSLVSQLSTWDLPGSRDRVLERLRPVCRAALAREPHAFVNLDMEEYRDLDLTLEVLAAVLAETEFAELEVGVVLQAYLPDSVAALERLVDLAVARREAGHAGIKVRLVKGANLAMEQVEAALHGWAQAPYDRKEDVDANYVRLLERMLRPELAGALRVGVASHHVFHVALAHLLAQARGVGAMLDVEMLQGMSPAQARVVREEVGSVLLYTPVVAPEDFDVAVSYLVRRLEENAAPQNFLHAVAGDRPGDLDAQVRRFRDSVAGAATAPTQRRRGTERSPAADRFASTTDSDPALPEVRRWARSRVTALPRAAASPVLATAADVEDVVRRGRAAAPGWAGLGGARRAAVLRRAADAIEERRGELVTAMAHEGGKTVAQADPEVSEAVDFARYYADRAEELSSGSLSTDGARFEPDVLTLVTPPWNFPVAIPTGGTTAALAAGSAVVVKPAHPVPACTEIVVEALHAAGVPGDVLQFVRADEGDVGRALVSHPGIGTVLLTGAAETARRFAGWRAGHPGGPRVLAETSGKNALVVTAAADVDLAVADLLSSAFGHAGQKCSAASLAILVGPLGESPRFARQLADAVRSLRVGWPTDLGVTMGPVIEPPRGKLRRALTTLEPGESWVVAPRQLDGTGRLWSPGLKDGVAPGSFFHLTECFGPVLGLMRARTLDDAIRLQNATAFGLTGGLHSLDEAEVAHWLARAAVGNAYVNRHITGAIVRRQPFGGWKGSAVGPGAKAGGPNYVAQLGRWLPAGEPVRRTRPAAEVRELLAALQPVLAMPARGRGEQGTLAVRRRRLAVAAESDAYAWAHELGREHDVTGLAAERNALRYRPAAFLWVRAGADAAIDDVVRLLLAARCVAAPVRVSLAGGLSDRLHAAVAGSDVVAAAVRRLADVVDRAETTAQLVARVRGGEVTGRLRVVGEEIAELQRALADETHVTLLGGPVLATGRRELLGALREQAVSESRHRYGHVSR
ncbi:bifunctional proline dehydrogenase/L-glutamate gamma-semialdehyde dehydrogenase [Georgenia sp. MJ173]|uniref:bifunctional proline dehydrogenase/L-glutamate gamma-semialdehyde dehydrogenase n=1 Tax=Georgenia sunbinii TaxID=3117728 RepID=UPI002F26D1ED